jgi:predicted lipoprotein with Yx(FWY)xxD motif
MKLKIFFALVSIYLAGCAGVEVKPMPTPNGKAGFSVACDGASDDWASCYKAAADACKGKYSVIDRQQDSTASNKFGPSVYRSLIVECTPG